MKASLITLFSICVLIFSGCTTKVAIDPATGQAQPAEYRTGYFYAPLDAPIGEVFKTAIREIDEMGYFRTGELHKETSITIYARKVGDEKITVKAYTPSNNEKFGSQSVIRIRVGKMGNLAESQTIYARIRDAL